MKLATERCSPRAIAPKERGDDAQADSTHMSVYTGVRQAPWESLPLIC